MIAELQYRNNPTSRAQKFDSGSTVFVTHYLVTEAYNGDATTGTGLQK